MKRAIYALYDGSGNKPVGFTEDGEIAERACNKNNWGYDILVEYSPTEDKIATTRQEVQDLSTMRMGDAVDAIRDALSLLMEKTFPEKEEEEVEE